MKLRLPSPALVVACVALAVSLGGTAVAATPAVKRALFADNAGKVQGKTAAQVAALPGPASSAKGLVSVRTQPHVLPAGGYADLVAPCAAGEAVVAGGFDSDGAVIPWDSRPSGQGWKVFLVNGDDSELGVRVYAVCVR